MGINYDVIIVGAGPAGIFAALELTSLGVDNILILEKGKPVDKRCCPIGINTPNCIECKPCSIMSGWGGAGAFSDGKLTLTTEFGGWLQNYTGRDNLEQLIQYVDDIYVAYEAPDRVFGRDSDIVKDLELKASRAGLRLVPAVIRHMGTENTKAVLNNMYKALQGKVTIKTGESVTEVIVKNKRLKGVKTDQGVYISPAVILAPGRDGAEWFSEQALKLDIPLKNNQVDLGVRVEVPAVTMKEFTDNIWEPKIYFNTKEFDDLVRTFCVNPNGYVVMENTNGIITVNGHAYADKKSTNTNFALLLSQEFTAPFDKPILYGRSIASLANMLSKGIIVQRYGDLKRGRRSTDNRLARGLVVPTLKGAVPGDLSLVLPHRYMVGIKECLEALDRVMPGVACDHTLLYGTEVKFYSARPELDNSLQTNIKGLWAIGDGAGVTRGLIQASASGIIAARAVSKA
ncbi:MAG: NAD(P)/FAD-dependent oxidoreductase [Syntrophomonadaceae bacterium]|nr:NAD(P)/FAD-dependent oxidoreductase [Syntrophomonadaceae bacterium]